MIARLLMIAGVLLVTVSFYYLIRLAFLLLSSYEFTDYGYGILTGKILLFVVGVSLLYFGISIKKKQKKP